MKFLTAASTALLALCAVSLESVNAHSWLVKPVGRDKGPRTDVDNSLGCPSSAKDQVTSFKAGEKIDVAYWRNNHLGGFIRWSIVPSGEETKANFDKNAFFYTCRESGPTCLPNGRNQRFSGDGSGANTISCGDKITLPDWLPAGGYTIQWMWFGVGSSSGNLGWAEPQFKSCADIKLTTSGSKTKAPSCPTFVGGDRVTKLENKGNNQCMYFHSTAIATSQYKGDNSKAQADYKFGIPADVEKCGGKTAGDSDSGAQAPAPATTKRPTTPTAPVKKPDVNPAPAPKPNAKPVPAPKPMNPSPSKKCVRRVRN